LICISATSQDIIATCANEYPIVPITSNEPIIITIATIETIFAITNRSIENVISILSKESIALSSEQFIIITFG
jgi:hypothetical protein